MRETPSPEELQLAQRNVARIVQTHPSLQASDELVSLYCGLRRLKGGSARISGKMLENWSTKVVQSTLIKTAYWVVPADRPVLNTPNVKPFLVDPASLDDLPPTLDTCNFVLVDQAVSRSVLGAGVFQIELTAGVSRDKALSNAPPLPPVAASREEEGSQRQDGSAPLALPAPSVIPADSSTAQAASSTPPALTLPTRVLTKQNSEPKTEQDSAEDIAIQMKQAFDNKRFHSEDELDASCASFWFKCYVEHLKESWKKASAASPALKVEDFVAALDPHAALCIKFCVKALLQTESFHYLKPFSASMEELRKVLPGFLPSLAEAVVLMSKADLSTDKEIAWDDAGLSLGQKTYCFKSAMYTQFVTLRATSRIQACMKDSTQADEIRLAFAKQMLASSVVAEQKETLEFAVGWFSALEESGRVKYLLQTPKHFGFLKQWCPAAEMLHLEPFSRKDGDFQAMTPMNYMIASKCLCRHAEFVQHVAQPVARTLLQAFANAQKLTADADSALQALAEMCFAEASSFKLGISPPTEASPLPSKDICFAAKDAMMGISRAFGNVVSKGPGEVLKMVREFLENQPKEAEKPKAVVQKPDAPKSVKDPKPSDGSSGVDFQLGDIIMTSSGKSKDKFDEKQGKITQILSKKCRVEILEGPGKGEIKDFAKEKLRLLQPEKPAKPETVKRPHTEDLDAESAKRARAANLFGDLPE